MKKKALGTIFSFVRFLRLMKYKKYISRFLHLDISVIALNLEILILYDAYHRNWISIYKVYSIYIFKFPDHMA